MGINLSSETSSIAQNVTNSAIQTSKNVCQFVCGNENENSNVTIENSSNVVVDFSETCSVLGTSCTVKNVLDSSITNMLSAASQQKETNLAGLFNFNVGSENNSMTQNIRNNVAQMISNTCKNQATNVNENTYVFVGNSSNIRVSFAQGASVSNANCNYDNSAKMAIYNSETAKSSQAIKNVGILGMIVICIMMIIMLIICFSLMGSLKGKGDKKKGQDTPAVIVKK